MKRYSKTALVLLLLVFGAAASAPAMAQHYGHGYGYGYGYGYGGVRFGISLGVPFYGPGYYPGYGYPAPAYAYPAPAYGYAYPGPAAVPSGTYVEQSVPQAAPAPAQTQGDWYYCANSNAYYPYVRECPGGWQRVPPTPPR